MDKKLISQLSMIDEIEFFSDFHVSLARLPHFFLILTIKDSSRTNWIYVVNQKFPGFISITYLSFFESEY